MRVLVIGGNGFIGSHLVDQLVARGDEVIVLDLHERRYDPLPSRARFIQGDLNHADLVQEALTGVNVVFHLAWTTIHEVSNQDPIEDITTNLVPSLRLLEACRHARVGRIVFNSSGGTVYGLSQSAPILETHPQNPISAYGITKLALEKYLQMFQHLYGLDYAILRPSVPYGPRQSPFARQGAVAVFLYRVGHGLPIALWGDGSTSRDYFYISDMIEALIASADRELGTHRIFNIGGGEEISLLQLIRRIENTVGQSARIRHQPARRFDAPRIVLDTCLAHHALGWQPQICLNEGLAKTWEWMLNSVSPPEATG